MSDGKIGVDYELLYKLLVRKIKIFKEVLDKQRDKDVTLLIKHQTLLKLLKDFNKIIKNKC